MLKYCLKLSFYQTFQINRTWVAKNGGQSNNKINVWFGLLIQAASAGNSAEHEVEIIATNQKARTL